MSTGVHTKSTVLISGAGPSGLVLALTLAKNGVPVRIIEKDREFHQGQRGAGAQPRTIEIYNYLGIAENIIKVGQPMKPFAVYKLPEGTEIIKTFSMMENRPSTPSIPFANVVMIGQHAAQGILRDHLARYNVVVERSTELVDFEQDEQGVVAHLVKHDGDKDVQESVQVSYLVGADGARSVVRKKLGLTFLGVTRPTEHLIVADIEITGLSPDYWHTWGDFATRTVVLMPTERPNVFSVFGGGVDADIQVALKDRDGLVDYILGVSNRHDLKFGEVLYFSEWRPNVRMVNKFGEGKVFVVGDAAHVHSPTGGQGLNSGIQDSFNLGWKLSLVCNSLSSPSILGAYNSERLPIIQDMLERTTKLLDKTLTYRANGDNTEGFARPPILRQLGVHCRSSPLVVDEQPEFAEAKKAQPYIDADPAVLFAGDRAPDAPALRVVARASGAIQEMEETSLFKTYTPTRHTVVVFAKTASEDQLQGIIKAIHTAPKGAIQVVVVLPEETVLTALQTVEGADLVVVDTLGHALDAYPPAVRGFSVFVVRPDGVVGAVVGGEEGVKKYIKGVFVD
ncbi:hypothetical protein EIP86_004167 [Pleurotus ostreatoroseus]|nr:hypothetical protein EIP86_004167 [Pleurotus ostreatoroseus]